MSKEALANGRALIGDSSQNGGAKRGYGSHVLRSDENAVKWRSAEAVEDALVEERWQGRGMSSLKSSSTL